MLNLFQHLNCHTPHPNPLPQVASGKTYLPHLAGEVACKAVGGHKFFRHAEFISASQLPYPSPSIPLPQVARDKFCYIMRHISFLLTRRGGIVFLHLKNPNTAAFAAPKMRNRSSKMSCCSQKSSKFYKKALLTSKKNIDFIIFS